MCKIITSAGVFFSSIAQDPYIIWFLFIVHKCRMILSPCALLIFSKLWFFALLQRSKGKQWPKMTKNSLLHLIFQESYFIWSSFMVRICKSRISPGAVYIFSKVEFSGSIVRLKGKKRPKYDKKLSVALQISGSINMIVIFSTHVWNDDIYICWFQFLKVLLFRVVSAENVKNSVSLHISGTVPHAIVVFGALS